MRLILNVRVRVCVKTPGKPVKALTTFFSVYDITS